MTGKEKELNIMDDGLAMQRAIFDSWNKKTCDYSFCDFPPHTNGLCYEHAREHYEDRDYHEPAWEDE